MTTTGCGMIPICMHQNKLYLLCGVENNDKVSDLGGRIDAGEKIKECAAREFYEESVGLLLPYDRLVQSNVYRRVKIGYDKNYISLIIKTNYKNVEDKYRELITYVKENNCKMDNKLDFKKYKIQDLYDTKTYPEGFFEFKELKWISLDDLKNNKYKLRNRFKLLLNKL